MFKELAEVMTIFAKYSEEGYMLGAEHDVIYVYVNPEKVSEEDIKRLDELGFHADTDDLENFYHFT